MRLSIGHIGKTAAVVAAALPVLLTGCLSDIQNLKTDVGNLKLEVYHQKQENQALKNDLAKALLDVASLKTAVKDVPREETLKNIRESQTRLYTQNTEIIREMQTINGRFDENKYFVDKQLKQLAADLEVLKSRTKTLAEGGAKAEDGQEAREIAERVSAIETEVANLRLKVASISAAGKPEAGATAEELYDAAYNLYLAKKYDESRAKMQEFLKQHHDHKLAGNAQYWIGESYYNEKQYDNAVLAFEDVIKKHPKNQKVPAAMLKQAYAFLELGDKNIAEGLLKELIKKYPKDSLADAARRKLNSIK